LVKALRIDPANTEFQIHLATIMANTGKEEDAIKIFGSILQREPQRDNALLELGLIYSRAGKFREALPLFAKAARINRGHPVIQYQYGIALTQTGRPADAIKHFQAALDMWPDQVEIRNALEEAQFLARSRK
jgi:protein O-mannosyl-transferase